MADDVVTLTEEQLLELRGQEAELGVPQLATEVDRPDGELGYGEKLAGAELLPGGPAVAAARHRLERARQQGAHPDEVTRLQRELADVAGLRLREHDQPLPTEGQGPVIHELVVTDVMNRLAIGKKRYGQPLRAFNGRSFLRDAYEEVLDLACYLRGAIEEEEQRERDRVADGAEEVPPPPPIRNGSVIVLNRDSGPDAWQRRDDEWWPLITPDDFASLSEEDRAAIEQHIGPRPQ